MAVELGPALRLRALLTIAFVFGALIGGSALAGCGGSSAADGTSPAPENNTAANGTSAATESSSAGGNPSPADIHAYERILHGLAGAAQSSSDYNALRRAKKLDVVEKAVIESFCNFAWQIGVNHEAFKLADHAYLVVRIKNSAEFNLNERFSPAVETAMDRLGRTIDLTALNANLVKRYKRACEH